MSWAAAAWPAGPSSVSCDPMVGIGRWTTCRSMTDRSSRPASAPTRSCRSTGWPTSWPPSSRAYSAAALCSWPDRMLARLQQATTLGALLLAALWAWWSFDAGRPFLGLAGAAFIVGAYAIVLALEFVLLYFAHGD